MQMTVCRLMFSNFPFYGKVPITDYGLFCLRENKYICVFPFLDFLGVYLVYVKIHFISFLAHFSPQKVKISVTDPFNGGSHTFNYNRFFHSNFL